MSERQYYSTVFFLKGSDVRPVGLDKLHRCNAAAGKVELYRDEADPATLVVVNKVTREVSDIPWSCVSTARRMRASVVPIAQPAEPVAEPSTADYDEDDDPSAASPLAATKAPEARPAQRGGKR
jgi:hypothetical protein